MSGDLALLFFGMLFLLGGGEVLVRGASAVARATGVPPVVVGLTIVAFGTSAPELAVNVLAAWRGTGTLSFGNVFGSNMANIGLILGAAGLLRALTIQSIIVFREIPMMLVATITAVLLSYDPQTNAGNDQFSRSDGGILLLLFSVFLYYTVRDLTRQREAARRMEREFEELAQPSQQGLVRSSLLIVGGLGALVGGAEFTVDGAMGLARAFDVPEHIIGLTIVALGTSLPELATSLIATLRGHVDLAVGNIVGSNIFNILLVAGATASIRPIPVPEFGHVDLAMTALLSFALWFMAFTQSRKIVRLEAALLVASYVGYMGWRVLLHAPAA